MNTHNILIKYKKEYIPKLSKICSYGIFSKGLKNKSETAVVNDPSVFEPLKFYCIYYLFEGPLTRSAKNIYAVQRFA